MTSVKFRKESMTAGLQTRAPLPLRDHSGALLARRYGTTYFLSIGIFPHLRCLSYYLALWLSSTAELKFATLLCLPTRFSSCGFSLGLLYLNVVLYVAASHCPRDACVPAPRRWLPLLGILSLLAAVQCKLSVQNEQVSACIYVAQLSPRRRAALRSTP